MKNLSACAQLVREHDYERFVTVMFAPPNVREALFTLYAFNYEVSKTREVVSETALGLIRLTWWREAIDEIYEGKPPREHEVVRPLADVITHYNLPKKCFDTLIYAREFDLEDAVPGNLKGLKNYVDYTLAPLLELSGYVLNQGTKPDYDFKNMARFIGLSGILRSVAYHAAQDRCYLPQDMLDQAGVKKYDVFQGEKIGDIQSIIYDIAGEIWPLLDQITYDETYRVLCLQTSLAKQAFAKLKGKDYNPFVSEEGAQSFSMLRLMLSYYLKRV